MYDLLEFVLGQLTAHGLTGLAFLDDNVNKTENFFYPVSFELANSGQDRVKTVVIHHIISHLHEAPYQEI